MKALAEQIGDIDAVNIYGRVVGVRGLMVEIAGPIHAMSVGARIVIDTGGNRFIPCEVIGFSGNNAVVMPFAGLEGVRRGCRAVIGGVARPRGQRHGGTDRRQGADRPGRLADVLPQPAAAGAFT
jgi:flagellum-specific ATP synthase